MSDSKKRRIHRNWLVVGIMSLVIIVTVVVTIMMTRKSDQKATQYVLERLHTYQSQNIDNMGKTMATKKNMLQTIVNHINATGKEEYDIQDELEWMQNLWNTGEFYRLSLIDKKMDVYTVDKDGINVGIRLSEEQLASIQRSPDFVVQGPVAMPKDHVMCMILSIPLKENGEIVGMVSGACTLDSFSKMAFGNSVEHNYGVYIVGREGNVVLGYDTEGEYVLSEKLGEKALYYSNILQELTTDTEFIGEYTYDDFCDGIQKGEKGYSMLKRKTTGVFYVSYEPIGINDWSIVYLEPKNVAEEGYQYVREYNDIMQIAIIIFCVIVLIVLLYIYQGTIHDLQERMREEQELAEARHDYEMAEAANIAKTEFLSRMSHDIRTPMNAIMGLTSIAETYIDDKKKTRENLAKIGKASRHLLMLINQVLDMSRIESGKMILISDGFDLRELIDNVVVVVKPQMEAQNQKFTVNMDEVENTHVIGDMQKLQQIFTNIVGNSVKYTPAGGNISIAIKETSTYMAGYRKYSFIFSDNGMGMSKEFQEVMFQPFTRDRENENSTRVGTGLGLSIAKSMVELMDGTIEVQSELGQGTTITINLMLRYKKVEDTAKEYVSKTEQKLETEHDYSGKRILLVEDNAINAEIVTEVIGFTGADVDWAKNGREAIDCFKASEESYYDLILMDIMMPVMNGYDATKGIRGLEREDAKTVPIIALSANAFASDKAASQRAGMNNHLSKPVDFEKLRIMMNEYFKEEEQ